MQENPVKSFAVIRADTDDKLDATISSLSSKGMMRFRGNPKMIESDFADRILENVMDTKVNNTCESAALIALHNPPLEAINKLKKIRPPAHIIIVTSRYKIYDELVDILDELEDLV